MIKRNGVAVMNQRTGNVALAKETLEIIKNKKYIAPSGSLVDISKSLDFAVNSTVLYAHDTVIPEPEQPYPTFAVSSTVSNETTAEAAVRLLSEGMTDIVALNFASARNQGGGFLSGAIAQEEDICRCSGLYSCLKRKPQFYNENILIDNNIYTDGIIYSPSVPFFRDRNNILLEKPFEISIISAPAPNLRSATQTLISSGALCDIICRRARRILQVAALNGHRNIILGAWGCGAFGNDPGQISSTFTQLISADFPHFENVCFAVYDNRVPTILFNKFKETLENY